MASLPGTPPKEASDAAASASEGSHNDGGGGRCNIRICSSARAACIPCRRVVERWPRTFAVLFGVVCPLFLLIFVAVICGYGLAELEGPMEIETNNDIIATQMALEFHASVVGNVTRRLPVICGCTFLLEEEQEERHAAFRECLQNEQMTGTEVQNATTNRTASESALDAIISNCTAPPKLDVIAIEATVQKIIYDSIDDCGFEHGNHALSFVCGEEAFRGESYPNFTIAPMKLLKSMNGCGKAALDVVEGYRFADVIVPSVASEEVTFNWIRCTDGEAPNAANELFNPLLNTSEFRPEEQSETVVEAWKANQQELYCLFLGEALAANESFVEAKREALQKSFAEADGFSSCSVNSWAGGWFFFTVMTTIGYGNTAPVTDGGRAMIFTLGFFSILMFAGLLAKAGSIVVAVVDDWTHRLRLHILAWPSIQAFVWGGLYYLWSFMIASYYVHWNDERLDVEIDYNDAYWFAYMSTTTVGLGDYYLDHSVIVGSDLLVWPLLILFGFVLLSAFLTKVGELIASLVRSKEQPPFAETLAEDERPMFSCCPTWLLRHEPTAGQEEVEAEDDQSMPGKEAGEDDAS